jgi:outer membrane protein assembly factor BamB
MLQTSGAALLSLLASFSGSGDWPQWRGAERDGLSHGVAWTAEGREVWRAEIGLGYSAASVADGRVFTFGFDTATSEDVLRALALADGKELWSVRWPGELRANQHEGGTLSTPGVAGELVVTCSSSGVVRAHRVADGSEVWRRDCVAEDGVEPGYYGFAGSPLVADGVAYVALERAYALEVASGALRWRSEPLGFLYSTPVRFAPGGAERLAIFGQEGVELFALDGTHHGRFPFKQDERHVNAATPILLPGGELFVSSGYEHGCARVDFALAAPRARFESKAMRSKMAGGIFLAGGVFGFDEAVLKALDLDGNERWRVRGLGSGALSGGDGKLAVLSSAGELVIARAELGAFTELARATLFEEGVCWTPPTIAQGLILARNNRGTLVCRDHRASSGAGPAPELASSGPAPTPGDLPAADALFVRHLEALGGAAARAALANLTLRGTYEQRAVGFVPAPYEMYIAGPDRRRVDIQLLPPLDEMFAKDGVPGRLARVCDGAAVFHLEAYRGDKLYGPAEERAERVAAAVPWAQGREAYASARTTGRAPFDERACWRVEASTKDGQTRVLWFDAASALLAGREAEEEALVMYRDYRAFEATGKLLVPTHERVFRPDGGIEELFRVREAATTPLAPQLFERSAKVVELLEERAQGK